MPVMKLLRLPHQFPQRNREKQQMNIFADCRDLRGLMDVPLRKRWTTSPKGRLYDTFILLQSPEQSFVPGDSSSFYLLTTNRSEDCREIEGCLGGLLRNRSTKSLNDHVENTFILLQSPTPLCVHRCLISFYRIWKYRRQAINQPCQYANGFGDCRDLKVFLGVSLRTRRRTNLKGRA